MIALGNVVRFSQEKASERLQFVTSQGTMAGRLHPAEGEKAILWVFGAGAASAGLRAGSTPAWVNSCNHLALHHSNSATLSRVPAGLHCRCAG